PLPAWRRLVAGLPNEVGQADITRALCPQPPPCPATSAVPSTASTAVQMRTKLSQLGSSVVRAHQHAARLRANMAMRGALGRSRGGPSTGQRDRSHLAAADRHVTRMRRLTRAAPD